LKEEANSLGAWLLYGVENWTLWKVEKNTWKFRNSGAAEGWRG
jgi:hypothetical protein